MSEEANEAELVTWLARTGQGDRAAFRDLYDRCAGLLLAVALRLLRDRSRAEDVLQDAFVQIWHRAADYHRGRGTAMGWMVSIVRYRAIDLLRREQRHSGTEAGAPEAIDFPELEDSHDLADCMERLSGSQQQSIALAFFEGLTHEELSRRLASPMGTIKSRIRRALTRLRECLEA